MFGADMELDLSFDDIPSLNNGAAEVAAPAGKVETASQFDDLPMFDDELEDLADEKEFTGFISGMSNRDYHSMDALSTSGIKIFNESPTQYWYYRNTPQKSKRVFDVGNMFHEINQFGMDYVKEHYIQQPEFNLRSPSERLERDNWIASLTDDHCVITHDDWNMVLGMRESVYKNATARELLEHQATTFEDSFFWNDPETGVWCRCRTDVWNPEFEVAVDLKSLAANLTWSSSVLDRSYHVQDAMYTDGIKQVLGVDLKSGGANNFWFLVTPKKETPYSEFKTLSDWHFNEGHKIYRDTLRSFKECQDNDTWFAPSETQKPKWAK